MYTTKNMISVSPEMAVGMEEMEYSILKMDGANFWIAQSIDHLGDGVVWAIYRFLTHVVDNNMFSSSLI